MISARVLSNCFAVLMKTTTPMIPHSVMASSNYAFVYFENMPSSGENYNTVPLTLVSKIQKGPKFSLKQHVFSSHVHYKLVMVMSLVIVFFFAYNLN